jgi:Ca-activated chloride channel family protein
MVSGSAYAESARESVIQGNELYRQGNFNDAINKYDESLVQSPEAVVPKFNKANVYYKLDDLSNAIDLYRQVAAESKDMSLVAKSKYNLGNSYFQQGTKQKDSNLQKAIEDMETAIGSWRSVLDIEPGNEKAARNIEVARLTIKDLLDQLKNQQDPNQPQDPNQQQQNQQQNQQQQSQQQQQGSDKDSQQSQDQQQRAAGKDPNQPQDKDQQSQQQGEDEKQQQDADKQKQQQVAVPDTTAQEILDKEQRQKKQRQILQRSNWQKVEKDW